MIISYVFLLYIYWVSLLINVVFMLLLTLYRIRLALTISHKNLNCMDIYHSI